MPTTRLLLLPGMLNTAAVWQWVRPALEDLAEIHVADFGTQASIAQMAASALELVDDSRPLAVAGFSMGGFVAAEMLARAPERIERIALIDTSVRTESPRQAAAREQLIDAASRDFEGTVVDAAGAGLHPDHRGDARLTDLIKAMARQFGLAGFVRQSRALMERGDYREVLAAARLPAAVICGASDELTPPRLSQELADLIPGASLDWIEPAAHMTLLEQPDQVAQALRRWLQR